MQGFWAIIREIGQDRSRSPRAQSTRRKSLVKTGPLATLQRASTWGLKCSPDPGIVSSKGCHNKVPHTRCLKTTEMYSPSSGEQKSQIKESAGLCSLRRLKGRIPAWLFYLLVVAGTPWPVDASLQSNLCCCLRMTFSPVSVSLRTSVQISLFLWRYLSYSI